jgi:predicted PurR-regulated permease PerM
VVNVRLLDSPLVQAVFVGFGLWLALRFFDAILWVVLTAVVGVILAATLAPVVRIAHDTRLPRTGWRVPRGIALIAIYVVGGIVTVVGGYVVLGLLIRDMRTLADIVIPAVMPATVGLDDLATGLGIPSALVPTAIQVTGGVQSTLGNALGLARSVASGLVTLVVRIFIVLALAFLLVLDSDNVMNFWVSLFPPPYRLRVREITTCVGSDMGRWLLSQVTVSTVVGLLAGGAAWLVGIPIPVTLGVLTGLVEIAPMVGPIVMVIPAALLGLLRSPTDAMIAGIAFFAIALLDANVLSPVITGRAVHLSPIIVILAIPIGATLFGIVGALIAVPIAAALKIVVVRVVLPWLDRVGGLVSS